MTKRERQEPPPVGAIRPRYGDARDRLAHVCPSGCGAALVQAELNPTGNAGPTARGTYACGAKFLAWADGSPGPTCVRLCQRKGGAEQDSVENVVVGDVSEGAPAARSITPEELGEFKASLFGLELDEEKDET